MTRQVSGKHTMRTDLDEAKSTIIGMLEAGASRQEVCTRFRCKTDTLTVRLKTWGYDHLKNQAGRGRPSYGSRKSVLPRLTQGSSITSSHLRKRLWREGLKPMHCEECGWARRAEDGRLPLELHHINGDRFDNRLANLVILCPNCHALKPTNSGSNVGRYTEAR